MKHSVSVELSPTVWLPAVAALASLAPAHALPGLHRSEQALEPRPDRGAGTTDPAAAVDTAHADDLWIDGYEDARRKAEQDGRLLVLVFP